MDSTDSVAVERSLDFDRTAARRVELLESLVPIALELRHIAHLEAQERARLGVARWYQPLAVELHAQRVVAVVDAMSSSLEH